MSLGIRGQQGGRCGPEGAHPEDPQTPGARSLQFVTPSGPPTEEGSMEVATSASLDPPVAKQAAAGVYKTNIESALSATSKQSDRQIPQGTPGQIFQSRAERLAAEEKRHDRLRVPFTHPELIISGLHPDEWSEEDYSRQEQWVEYLNDGGSDEFVAQTTATVVNDCTVAAQAGDPEVQLTAQYQLEWLELAMEEAYETRQRQAREAKLVYTSSSQAARIREAFGERMMKGIRNPPRRTLAGVKIGEGFRGSIREPEGEAESASSLSQRLGPHTTSVVSLPPMQSLKEVRTEKDVTEWFDALRERQPAFSVQQRNTYITPATIDQLTSLLQRKEEDWLAMSDDQLRQILLLKITPMNNESLEDVVGNIPFDYDPCQQQKVSHWIYAINNKIVEHTGGSRSKDLSVQTQKAIIERLKKRISEGRTNKDASKLLATSLIGTHSTLQEFLDNVMRFANEAALILSKAKLLGTAVNNPSAEKPKSNEYSGKRGRDDRQPAVADPPPKKGRFDGPIHEGCGRAHDASLKCLMDHHPNFNRDWTKGIKWEDTSAAKAFAAAGLRSIPNHRQVENGKIVPWTNPKKTAFKKVQPLYAILHNATNDHECVVYARVPKRGQPLRVLLDSGAHSGDYVKSSVSDIMLNKCSCSKIKICSTFNNCVTNNKCGVLNITLVNNNSSTPNEQIEITTTARIVDELPYDIIIGLPTIRKYDLTQIFRSIFSYDDSAIGSHFF